MSLFSHRTQWDLSENPLSLALKARKASGEPLFDLTESNPTRAGISYPGEFILSQFNNTDNLLYTPEPAGFLKARQAVAVYLASRHSGGLVIPRTPPAGADEGSQNIILTSSTSEAYSYLFRLLTNPGDQVLLPAPSYPLFSYLAGLNDIEPAYYQLHFDFTSWWMDLDLVEKAAKAGRVKAVVLVSPNNPTGSFISVEELARLNALCVWYGMSIISDEVFSDYLFGAARERYVSAASNTGALSFALGGLSKALALPQMKLGWIVVNGPEKDVAQALARLEIIADTYLSVNTPVQNACVEWLPRAGVIQAEVMRRVTENLNALNKAVAAAVKKGIDVYVYPVAGGWYAVLRADLGVPEDEWAVRLLQRQGVYVHPGFYFDFETDGHIVLSLLPQPDVFRAGVELLLRFVASN